MPSIDVVQTQWSVPVLRVPPPLFNLGNPFGFVAGVDRPHATAPEVVEHESAIGTEGEATADGVGVETVVSHLDNGRWIVSPVPGQLLDLVARDGAFDLLQGITKYRASPGRRHCPSA